MLPGWIDWVSFILSVFSAAGLAYLIFQTLFDALPALSYRLKTDGVRIGMERRPIDVDAPYVTLSFTIRNRTSRLQRLQAKLLIADSGPPSLGRWTDLEDVHLIDATSEIEVDPRDFEVPAGDGRALSFSAAIPPPFRASCHLQLEVHDNRLGRRHWSASRTFTLGDVGIANSSLTRRSG